MTREKLFPFGTLLFVSTVGMAMMLTTMQEHGLFYDTKKPSWSFEIPSNGIIPQPSGEPDAPLLPTEVEDAEIEKEKEDEETAVEHAPVAEVKQEEHLPHGRTLTVTVTAYCTCPICCGIWSEQHPSRIGTNYKQTTRSGTTPTEGRTIAVDPNVIPLGTEVIMDGHTYIAEDIGGAIKGNHIDLYFSTHERACAWGKQTKQIYIKD